VISEFTLNEERGYNLILGLFGLKSRSYYNEPSTLEGKSLLKIKKPLEGPGTSLINQYIRRQLEELDQNRNYVDFWNQVDKQMGNSFEFLLLNLVN
jgi:hypothetical protein